jgi:hypothetical protein
MISLTSTSSNWDTEDTTLPMPLPGQNAPERNSGFGSARVLDADVPASWQAAIPVNTSPDAAPISGHAAATIATNCTGEVWAVWCHAQHGSKGLALSRYEEGLGWSRPEMIDIGGAASVGYTKLHLDAWGNALLIWRDSGQDGSHIWAKRFVNRKGWDKTLMLSESGGPEVFAPELVWDEQGHAVVAWQDAYAGCNRLWARRFDLQNGWESAQLLTKDCVSDASGLQLAMGAHGEVLAIWRQLAGDCTKAWVSACNPSGQWNRPQPLGMELANPAFDSNIFEPRMAANDQGRALAIWVQIHAGQSNVWACWREANGHWGHAKCIASGRKSQILQAHAALSSSGQAVLVWEQCNAQRVQLAALHFDPDVGWGDMVVVQSSSNPGVTLQPALRMDSAGNVVLAWQQREELRRNVWVSRYVSGGNWRSPRPIAANHGLDAFDPHLAVCPSGQAALVWQATSTQRAGLWASLLR